MKRRIAVWAGTGFLVACCWVLYAFATAPDYEIALTPLEKSVWTFACITCPVLLAGIYFSWVLPINAATYVLVGLIVETLRQKLNAANNSQHSTAPPVSMHSNREDTGIKSSSSG